MIPKYHVGVIAGAFDILHPGYIRLFKEAKANVCDDLIILLHEDPSAERNKPKPIFSTAERLEILHELKCVDGILVYESEEQLHQILKVMKPNVRILGSDYRGRPVTGSDLPIPIYFIERNHNWSETRVKKLIIERGETK